MSRTGYLDENGMFTMPEWEDDVINLAGNVYGKYSTDICDLTIEMKGDEPMVNGYDPVNHPDHYTSGEVECIDAIKSSMTQLQFEGYLQGNVMKYIWRYRHKGHASQDLKKARWYLDKLINEADMDPALRDEASYLNKTKEA